MLGLIVYSFFVTLCSYSTSCGGGQPMAATSYVLLGCHMHE